jgi:SAM-dependent methyltransferase
MYEPDQLATLVGLLDDALPAPGSVLEVGCAYGDTTVFLNRHLDRFAPDRAYFAIDTFAGFTEEDVSAERSRGLSDYDLQDFQENSYATFQRTMDVNHLGRVRVVQADANRFAFASTAPVAFCLVDVDLYRPVTNTLQSVYEHVASGGILVVDDCAAGDPKWRGAYDAYIDFVTERGLPVDIRTRKLGVIRKP